MQVFEFNFLKPMGNPIAIETNSIVNVNHKEIRLKIFQ